MSFDIFGNSAFELAAMTAAINTSSVAPSLVSSLGIFQEEGVNTTTVWVDRLAGRLQLVANKERGDKGQHLSPDGRNAVAFKTMHLPQEEFVFADSVQNVRAFGSDNNLETVQNTVNQKLMRMRANLDATMEYHRVGALLGKVYDADGTSVINDLYDQFGLTKTEVAFGLASNGAGVNDFRNKARSAMRQAKQTLGGNPIVRGWVALCSPSFYDKFVAHEEIKTAFNRYNESEFLRTAQTLFSYAGIQWTEYDGMVGADYLIPEDRAILVPLMDGLCITRFAPAPWVDTVNTIGLPYYARLGEQKDEYVQLKSNSNPIHICTAPDAIITLKP